MVDREKILGLYFVDKYKQIEIVRLVDVPKSTVNRIIVSDQRYLEEKNSRQKENRVKNRRKTINYITKKRMQVTNDLIYERLKQQHINDVRELSGGKKVMSNRTYRDCNPSIYRYNSKSNCYILKKGIVAGADVPKRINWKNF